MAVGHWNLTWVGWVPLPCNPFPLFLLLWSPSPYSHPCIPVFLHLKRRCQGVDVNGDRGAAPELRNAVGTPLDLWGPGGPQPSLSVIGAEFFKLMAVCSHREAPFPAHVLGLLTAYRTTPCFPSPIAHFSPLQAVAEGLRVGLAVTQHRGSIPAWGEAPMWGRWAPLTPQLSVSFWGTAASPCPAPPGDSAPIPAASSRPYKERQRRWALLVNGLLG